MARWAIIRDNKIVNLILADSKEIAEEVTGLEAIDDENWIGIGFEMTSEGWRPPYPTDGANYIWNQEYISWQLVEDSSTEE